MGNVLHRYISPCGKDDGFQLKFVFGGVPAALHIHFAQRVKAVSRLCIFQFQPGFQSEPEIREFIGKGILAGILSEAKFRAPTSSVSGSFSMASIKQGISEAKCCPSESMVMA